MGLNFGNQLFPPRTEFLRSFDYKDILSGNGYIQFFGGCAYNGAGTLTYILNTERFDTADQLKIGNTSQYYTELTANSATTTSFDAVVGQTMKVFGKVSCAFLIKAGNNDPISLIRATLYKDDGSETSIIEIGETNWVIGITGTNDNWKRFNFSGNVTTPVKLNKGDTLRLKIQITTPNTGPLVQLHHDPNNRETITISSNDEKTALILNVPFKVEE